jgi:hypothetical protein
MGFETVFSSNQSFDIYSREDLFKDLPIRISWGRKLQIDGLCQVRFY